MSLQTGDPPGHRSGHPLLTELAAVVAVLAALSLWDLLARGYVGPAIGIRPGGAGHGAFDDLLLVGAVSVGLFLVGAVAVVGAYVAARDVAVGLALPASDRVQVVVGAVVAPVVLVAATKLFGAVGGTAYGTLLQRSYGAAATVEHALATTALGLFVSVPTLLIVCQVVVQGSLRRVVGGDGAVALTTVVAGFLLVDASGGIAPMPEPGKLVGAALFVVAIAVAQYGSARFERRRLRYLAFVPAALLVGLTVVTGVAAVGTVPAVLFLCVKVAVLGVAAYAYDRTGSLLAPALTYASFLATSEAVVYVFEAGVQHW